MTKDQSHLFGEALLHRGDNRVRDPAVGALIIPILDNSNRGIGRTSDVVMRRDWNL